MLELASVDAPDSLDGFSLLTVLDDEQASVREELLIEYYSDAVFPRIRNMGYRALRTARYKYIRYRDLRGMDELYELAADPYELDNLISGRVPKDVPAGVTKEVLKSLDTRLNAIQANPAQSGKTSQQ
jgi:arylsulfatase A-like enzyme